jgi:hypothetical protein
MPHVLIRIVIGVLLVIHGVAHLEITRVWGARESSTSWLVGTSDGLGTVASTVALIGFALAGLALFGGLGLWRPLAVAAACVSLVMIGLYWDPKMALGVAIDLGLVLVLLWSRSPGHELLTGLG